MRFYPYIGAGRVTGISIFLRMLRTYYVRNIRRLLVRAAKSP